MRSFPGKRVGATIQRNLGSSLIRTGFGLVVLLVIAGLVWNGPVLLAQDGSRPQPPDGSASHLFLPAVAGGAALEAGAVIPDQFIVVLHAPAASVEGGAVEPAAVTATAEAARLAANVYGEVLYVYDSALTGFAVRVPAGEATVAAAALEDDPNVDYIEPDRVVRAVETDATQTGATWGLDRIDQVALPLNSSYTYPNTGSGVHAYIIDTGMRITHAQFSGRVGGGYTAINDGRGVVDCNGHGTHVAGTVGGTTYGVAKQVTLHPVRVLDCNGSGSNAGVIAGVDWVKANRVTPAVANMSLGGGASAALDTAVANAIAANVTFAVAAGNDNLNACNYSPARTAAALTVGATTSTDARASYSNYGTCLDIFAPGSSITSAWYSSDTAITTISGTSMATPHVAGVAALYLAANGSATPAQVAQALTANAPAKVTNPGTGSPNRLLYVGFMGGTTPPTPVPTPTPQPSACTNLLKNPGFESGRVNWTESSTHGYALICNGTSCGTSPTAAHTGSYFTWLAGANSEVSQTSQTVVLPAGQKTTLSFWSRITSSDACGYDYGYVRVTAANGTTTNVKTYNLCTSTQTSGWVKTTVDLSTYAGQTVTLAFRATTDTSAVSNFFVDDTVLVSGSTCVAAAGTDLIEAAAADAGEDIPASAAPKPQMPDGPGVEQR